MASFGAVLGGIAASPFRAVGGIAKGSARMAGAGLKGLAMTAMDVTGALPLFAAAAGIKKGITAGYKKGKELLRPIGEGAVAEDSAIAAIAAAASETAKIQAETDKIEAETDALTGKKKAIAKTSMGGVDVDILEKIYGEVVSIRGIVGDADPESEKKELELDEAVRHKNFLKALAALGFGGKEKKDKGPGFFGDLLGSFKGLLSGIIAGLGLAGLIKFWPQLVTAFETIVDAIANINEFITDMKNFFSGAWDWLTNTTPSDSQDAGAAAAAARAVAMKKATRGKYSHRSYKRGTPERILTKGQDKLTKANELVKKRKLAEANRLKKVAAQNKLRLANEARARKLAGMKGPTTGATSSTKALAAYKRSITAGSRGRMMTGLNSAIETRSNLRWRTNVANYIQRTMGKLGVGLAEYNLERAKAGQVANTKKFLEKNLKSENKLRKVVVRAFTGEKIMTPAQIEGAQAKTGKNVLVGKEQANVKRIYNTGIGRTNLTLDEISRLRKAGYNVKIKPAVGPAELPKVTVHQTTTTVAKNGGGKVGSFVGEGEIRANADSRFRRVHRIANAAVQANTGKSIKTGSSTSQAMVQEAHIASKSGAAGKIQERLAGRGFRLGTRIFGTALIGYHLAKQMGDYYVEVYMPQLAQIKMELKRKLGREPLPNELKGNSGVIKARAEFRRFFHTVGIMAASGLVVGALAAKVGSIIGAKVGALMGGMSGGPAGAALGVVLGGLVGGIAFAVGGFFLGEWIAGALVAGADKMVGGNFVPAGADYMPAWAANFGDWYANYLIEQENKNFEAKLRQQKAEAILQKDMTSLRESLGMGKDKGLGSEAMKIAMNLKRKAATTGGITDAEKVVLDEYLQRVEGGKAKASHLESISGTSMMGANYSQTKPKKKKGFWGGVKSMLGFGDDEEDETAPQTRRVPGRTPQALNSVLGKSSLSPTAMIDADMEAGLGQVNDKSTASLGNNIQSGQAWTADPSTIGTTLTALGKNGGQPSADVVITNINSTTNADHQQVSSTSSTSNVITFDKAASYSPMRARYAL